MLRVAPNLAWRTARFNRIAAIATRRPIAEFQDRYNFVWTRELRCGKG
jgi:hypothetical protein